MTAKADLPRALENINGPEDAVRAEVLTVARRLKMSAGAIIPRLVQPQDQHRKDHRRLRKPECPWFNILSLGPEQLDPTSTIMSRTNQQDECESVQATVSSHATHANTHKNGCGETLADGNPILEEAFNKKLFSVIQRLVSMLDEERIASKDRELRLNQKINEFSAQVESLTERLTDQGKETQARDE